MYSFFNFSSIREGLIFIAVLSFFLVIALIYEYQQKRLEKIRKDLESLISSIEMLEKYKW